MTKSTGTSDVENDILVEECELLVKMTYRVIGDQLGSIGYEIANIKKDVAEIWLPRLV